MLLLPAVVALAVVAASVSTSSAHAARYVSVSQGAGAVGLSGYQPFEQTDPSTPEQVSFILQARNVGQLESQVLAGMPHGYLSVGQFAGQYGQSPLVIAGIRGYLALFGIHSTAMPDGLDIQTNGTAGQYNKAFQIVQQDYRVPFVGPQGHRGHGGLITVHGAPQNPKVPSEWGPYILAILGLSNYPSQSSDMVGTADGMQTQGSTSQGLNNSALFPADFAKRYDLKPVQQAGGTGRGRTIGIVTLAADRPDVVAQFWHMIGLHGNEASTGRISTVDVDGGPGAPSYNAGSDETTLDMEQSGGLAPDANVRVYQAPNTDAGFADAFYQAASDNVADSVSASWGESETILRAFESIALEDPNYQNAFDQAFLELDAQGQSTFLSAGDSGAYPASRDLGSTDRTAGNPDGSPWVTSAGGTTLPGPFATSTGLQFDFPVERTWGWDYLWASARPSQLGETEEQYAESHVVGGGGGYSGFEAMPSYQTGVRGTTSYSAVEYLKPTDYSTSDPYISGLTFGISLPWDWNFNATPRTMRGSGNGRATPDVSTDGDPETGYLVWYPFDDDSGDLTPTYEQFGGTSFVAPQLNGSTAAIDSWLGHRVGFWNPAIYQFATSRNSPFTPLDASGTSNDNLYYTGTPGNVYNVGSGLGTPDLAKLAGDFRQLGF
jgi:subtilase family serine protease